MAPVAETQAALFVNLDTTFTALASSRGRTSRRRSPSPAERGAGHPRVPVPAPFLRNNAAFFRELRPGVATLPHSAPILAQAFEVGTRTLPKTLPINAELGYVFESLANFSEDPLVRQGVEQLTRLSASLKPTLAFLTPAQTICNYATLWFRNVSSLLSEGDQNGTWQRFIIIPSPSDVDGAIGPNNEIGPASAPANGPSEENHLHSNPYPNTASPGQTRECEAGNERYAD